MNYFKKSLFLVICFVLTSILGLSQSQIDVKVDGGSVIIKEGNAHSGYDRSSSIDAFINGHTLTVTFTENLGDVLVEVTTASGGTVDYGQVWTPDSFIAYIYSTGSYVVTITLENGDEYYGEFEVVD